jgi:hypothetical protein
MLYEMARTLSIVRMLAQGERLKLPIGTVAMGDDMSIGFVLTKSDGAEILGGMSTMDLKQLNGLLNKYGANMVIPITKRRKHHVTES